jgi:formyl-CoA transferase
MFKTKDGGYVRIGAYSPKAVDAIKTLFDDEEITKEKLEKWASETNRDEAVEFILKAKLPVAPIYHLDDTVADPHLHARGMFQEIEHPTAGKYNAITFPFKMSKTQPEIKSPAPVLGQDNKHVICDILGKSEEYFEELKKKGIVAWI